MRSGEPSDLNAGPGQSKSQGKVVGVWLLAVALSAWATYAAREWLLFVYIALAITLMIAFVPKHALARAVSVGIAVGIITGLAFSI